MLSDIVQRYALEIQAPILQLAVVAASTMLMHHGRQGRSRLRGRKSDLLLSALRPASNQQKGYQTGNSNYPKTHTWSD
jgi:hypothetical protein